MVVQISAGLLFSNFDSGKSYVKIEKFELKVVGAGILRDRLHSGQPLTYLLYREIAAKRAPNTYFSTLISFEKCFNLVSNG